MKQTVQQAGCVLLCFAMLCGCALPTLRPIDRELVEATTRGDRARLDAALQQGADVNAHGEDGWTPLMFAARSGDADAVAELLRRGAKVNAANDTGETALMVCNVKVVKLLVDAGASFDAKGGTFNETPLMVTSDVEKTRALLAAGAPVDARDPTGSTALWYAALRGQSDRARVLIAAGANVNVSNGNTTPLLVAAQQADAEVIRVLLHAGADPQARSANGQTALHFAAKNLRRGVVEAVLATKPNVNSQDSGGQTPLMLAAQDGYTENVRALLADGADPNIRNATGQSPIEWAVAKGNQDLVTLLRGAGAQSATANIGIDDLKRAARTGGLEVFTTDLLTDGRVAKIRGKVFNRYNERITGIRYEVILMASEESKPRDTLRYRTDTTIDAGQNAPLKLDVESMYFGSDTRVLIRALPAKVGDRELPLPPGWRE